jgi:hypothetical protein
MMRSRSVWSWSVGREAGWSRGAWIAAALLLLGFGLTLAPAARAGEYHVYSCRTPAGAVAPTSGWSGSINGESMYDIDSCASGGSLTAALDGSVAHGANVSDANWTFSAPAGTQVAAARLWRAGEARSSVAFATTVYWLAAPNDIYDAADIFDKCNRYEEGCTGKGNSQTPMAKENLLEVPPGNLSGATHIYMNAACGGSDGYSCPAVGGGYSVAVSLYAADITLADNTPPTASNVGGSLAAGESQSGVGDISFSATDTGSGLYEAVFLIDGHAVSSQLLSPSSESCRNLSSAGGVNAFLYVQPCPLALSDDLSFNTALAPNGSHLLTVQLLDAAGNAATILNRQVTFANNAASAGPIGPNSPLALRGAANGTNASDQAKLTARWLGTEKTVRTSSYGHADRITGRLMTSTGRPISGAMLDVSEVPAYEGAKPVRLAEVRTEGTGAWALRLPKGVSSSTLRVDYRSHQKDTVPVATAALTLRVHAGITLRIAPRTSSVGGTIFFSGILHGVPVPPGGKQLVLEASSGGEWIEFRTIDTDPKGRYRARYRFKLPGPVTYRFRIRSPYEADFPFLAGTSNVVSVYER